MLDDNGLIILLNMSGWLVVGYLIRDYFQETKKIKHQLYTTLTEYNQLKADQRVQEERINSLEDSLAQVAESVSKIQDSLEENNRALIYELKEQLREFKRS